MDRVGARVHHCTQCYKYNVHVVPGHISSAESQMGAITTQRYSVENQKGAIARLIVQRTHPSGPQQNIFEY